VAIALRAEPGADLLTVRDDGKGIDATAVQDARSLGLLGMRERCLLVGGTFAISGEPGRGTTIVVRIPRGGSTDSDASHPAG
jgi:signal transduction histidine kinase